MRKNARAFGQRLSETAGFAFRRRYNLPPTDPRWLNATLEDIYLDIWAHAFIDNPKLKDEVFVSDDDHAADLAEMEAEALALEAKQAAPTPAVKVLDESDWEEI